MEYYERIGIVITHIEALNRSFKKACDEKKPKKKTSKFDTECLAARREGLLRKFSKKGVDYWVKNDRRL